MREGIPPIDLGNTVPMEGSTERVGIDVLFGPWVIISENRYNDLLTNPEMVDSVAINEHGVYIAAQGVLIPQLD